ncbi:restriction endonuclease subunit S [Limosilactobacillus reuteri]|uniref:restriction endonuclease subunit S n=1 Tax=Limosilactobacillus reuteri TaxID=1598 RepID=UPI00399479F2
MDKKPEKLVPEVRFKGFTDDWEQHKLGDIANIGDGLHGTPKYDANGKYHFINGNNLIDGKIQITKETKRVSYSALSDDDKSLDNLTILMSINGTIGQLAFYNKEPIKLGKSVAYIRFGNLSTLSFYYGALMASNTQQYFNRRVTGTTIKNLGLNEIRNFKYPIPSETEQKKIGKLIKLLNATITLQQRKLEQLKLLEKALQQKLFPNSFQEKPLLRILHGDNSWWNSYIGEVFTERVDKGSSEKLLSVSITDGVYPFDESKRKNNSSNDKHNYKKVFQNDIAYNSMRLWQGALGVSKYEGIVSPAYTVLKPLANQNSIFYEFMFKNIDMLHIFQRNSQGLTSDTWNLKFNQLQHIKIKTTNLNSQNKIAKLLIKIEELKNNESNYYHNLMILKKYLLQKLFI